jgi:prepilin peptidase CpaA
MASISPEVAWLVSIILVEAAIIDGRQLRVPNWLTFHFLVGGLLFAWWREGGPGLLWSLEGALVGLATLLPLYAIGGMGAGDVKLMAGLGAWVGPSIALGAFVTSTVVGALMALAMVIYSGKLVEHAAMFVVIVREIVQIRNPTELSERAAERKPRMLLLPYGIPMAVGSISYMAWIGLLR